jgi:FtsH-binding integral membrane protein
MIIERAENGDKDVITHAMLLFVDLFDLFVKILQILIKLKEDGERKNKK